MVSVAVSVIGFEKFPIPKRHLKALVGVLEFILSVRLGKEVTNEMFFTINTKTAKCDAL